MWDSINAVLDRPFSVLFGLVDWLPTEVWTLLLGALSGIGALLVFGRVSDQAGIERAKRRIQAHLLELRLFQDDLWVTLRAQGNVLRYNLAYLARTLVPALVLFPAFALILVQLENRAAYRPLQVDEPAVVRVRLEPGSPPDLEATLVVPEGLLLETPGLRKQKPREVVWRVRARVPGSHVVQVRVGGAGDAGSVYERRVHVASGTALWPSVYPSSDPRSLLAASEAALSPGAVREILVEYPLARPSFGGLSSAAWWFFGASLVAGFALRGPLGVQI